MTSFSKLAVGILLISTTLFSLPSFSLVALAHGSAHVLDESFEAPQDPTGWVRTSSNNSTFEITTTQAKTGKQSALITSESNTGESYWLPPLIQTTPGTTFDFTTSYL